MLLNQIEWHDLSVAIWLLNQDANPFNINTTNIHNLLQLPVQYELSDNQNYFQDAKQVNLHKGQEAKLDSLLKTAILFNMTGQFCQKLLSDNLYKAYKLMELPARLSLYFMQTQGIRIDYKNLKKELERLADFMEKLEDSIFKIAGDNFNLNDSKKVADLIYDKLGLMSYLDTEKKSPKKSVKPQKRSTDKLVLIELRKACGTKTNLLMTLMNLLTLLMEWRKLNHSYHSLVSIRDALSFEQQSQNSEYDFSEEPHAFIYCKSIEWSVTGRMSMENPNLINLAKDYTVSTIDAEGNQNLDKSTTPSATIQLRKLICGREQYVLVSADYSQLELRILAHFSKDPALIEALNDSSRDVFKLIVVRWKKISYYEVTDAMRQQAKQICYGLIYGMGDEKLASELEVTKDEAIEFRRSFLEQFPQIEPFVNSVIDVCTEQSYVQTISHRRRYIENIYSDKLIDQWKGARQSVNTTIQGTAADLIKLSMVAVDEAIRTSGLEAALVMQMHDELMYEVRSDKQEQQTPEIFARLLKSKMEAVSPHLIVKLPVKVRMGPNWGSLKDLVDM